MTSGSPRKTSGSSGGYAVAHASVQRQFDARSIVLSNQKFDTTEGRRCVGRAYPEPALRVASAHPGAGLGATPDPSTAYAVAAGRMCRRKHRRSPFLVLRSPFLVHVLLTYSTDDK